MPSPADYRLRVTAGTSYDPATHVPVAVNDAAPLVLHGPGADVALNVRVRGGRLAPPAAAAANAAYFDAEPHKHDADTYSIGLWLVPRRRLAARDLVWGNDFDAPIRQWLPPGFGAALRFVTWWVDPGLEGDPYGDRPFLYGPALSSFNRIYVGDAAGDGDGGSKMDNAPHHPERGLWFSEGGSTDGRAWRTSVGCPGPSDDQDANEDDAAAAAARSKWALSLPKNESGTDADAGGDAGGETGDNTGDNTTSPVWTWEPGRGYGLDFYNGFVDFDALAVRLPGRSMLPTFPLLHFWDGKTSVRYVLRQRPAEGEGKDKDDDKVLLVVVFALVPAAEEATTTTDSDGAAAADNNTAISIDDVD